MNLSENNIGGYQSSSGKLIPTPDGPKAIAYALRTNSALTDLDLRNNSLNDAGISAIFEAIVDNRKTKLTSLNISGNAVGPAGSEAVTAMVQRNLLTVLNAKNMQIGSETANDLVEALHVNHSLKKLDLSKNRLDKKSTALLKAAAKEREGLELLL